jgi:hypothetical protein
MKIHENSDCFIPESGICGCAPPLKQQWRLIRNRQAAIVFLQRRA